MNVWNLALWCAPFDFFLMSSFYPKYTGFGLEKYREVIFHDTAQWWKKWTEKLTRRLQNDIRNLFNFLANSQKSGNLHLDGIYLPKAYKYLGEKVQKSLCLLKSDANFEEKLTFGSNNDMRNLVNFNVRKGKSENLHLDVVLLLSIAYKVSAQNVKKSYLSWHWKKIETYKKNWLFW